MTIHLTATWQVKGVDLDARLVPLLRTVAKQGSLNRAVASLQLSYRHAWGMLGRMEQALGRPLVSMERGRGARLTPFAEKLLEADAAAAGVLSRELAPNLQALNSEAPASRMGPTRKPLVIHASHDLALLELRAMLSDSEATTLDLRLRGSLDSLASLARGECDVAGFHLPETSAEPAAFAPYRPWLRSRGLRLIRFVERRQGLIVARDNPKRLLTLADLAEKGARFVNRQPGSGTRLCFDRLLAAAKLRPAQIRGYQVEEFTHAAIAATVASGMADAGFGIEAAARQQGLDFVPLAPERYFLAARQATLARPAMRAVLEVLGGSVLRKWVETHAGYGSSGIGEIIVPREALPSG